MLVAPFAAMLVQMAISRSREYQADRMGAMICGNPMWLASALLRIHNAVQRTPNIQAERIPAAAHVFIINPLTGQGIDNLFSTHPNVENRIRALKELAIEMGQLPSTLETVFAGSESGYAGSVERPAGQSVVGQPPLSRSLGLIVGHAYALVSGERVTISCVTGR